MYKEVFRNENVFRVVFKKGATFCGREPGHGAERFRSAVDYGGRV